MAEQQLPVWNSEGIEPPANLQIDGWQPGVKPPAQYFDWLFNRAYKCLEELQAITEALETDKANGTELTTLNNKVTQHLDDYVKQLALLNAMANPPRARYSTSVPLNLPESTWGIIPWDIKDIDTDSFVSQSDKGKIVINVAGDYLISANLIFQASTYTGARNTMISKNEDYLAYQTNQGVNSTSAVVRSECTTISHLEEGDIIEIRAYQENGGTCTIAPLSKFSITKIAGFS